jgi:hypothetical protein
MKIIKEIRLDRTVERSTRSSKQADGTWVDSPPEKQFHKAIGVVRTSTYAKSLNYFMLLAAAVRETFPDVKDEDLRVVHFGGNYYKGTMGLEFDIKEPCTTCPEGWAAIHELELVK